MAGTLERTVSRYIRRCFLEESTKPPQRIFVASKVHGRLDPGGLRHTGSLHAGAGGFDRPLNTRIFNGAAHDRLHSRLPVDLDTFQGQFGQLDRPGDACAV